LATGSRAAMASRRRCRARWSISRTTTRSSSTRTRARTWRKTPRPCDGLGVMGSPAVAAGAPLGGEPAIVPPALRPRGVVRVVAPSGPFEPALVWRGLGWLAERYRVRFDRGIFSRRGYLAGDDARRAEELARAIVEPEVEAVFCARGGFGASRYVHRIDFSALRSAPRWVVGFSDVTAIHVECASVGVASLHAANV